MRTAWLTLLLLAPLAGGCLGDAEEGSGRLARPTTEPITVPTQATPRTPTVFYNLSDPGYRVETKWRVGDGWDYESNASRYLRIRVIDTRLSSGTTYYVLEERSGRIGHPPSTVNVSWVDGQRGLRINSTAQDGAVDRYHPGIPVTYYRNGSFVHNHTRTEPSGRVSVEASVNTQSRLFGPHQTLLFPWGYVEAKRVEHVAFTRVKGATSPGVTTMHWAHRDYGGDVQFELPGGETFKLTAVKVNDFRRGTLHS